MADYIYNIPYMLKKSCIEAAQNAWYDNTNSK